MDFPKYYYATLLINKVDEENLLLKIPPEIKHTVEEVLEKVATQEKNYGY